MIKLRQVNPENVWYRFEDEVDFSQYEDKMVIAGNRDFKEYGDSDLIKIVKGNYYDDDETLIENEDGSCYEDVIGYDYKTAEELEKRQKIFDFSQFSNMKKETKGRPVNVEDPFPVDDQIKKLEEQLGGTLFLRSNNYSH